MAEAKPTPGKPPSAGGPSTTGGMTGEACVYCSEPIGEQEASRVHIANSPTDRTGRVHAKCLHERGMMRAAMGERRSPKTP